VRTSQQTARPLLAPVSQTRKVRQCASRVGNREKEDTSIAQGEVSKKTRGGKTEKCSLFRRDEEPDLTRSRLVLATRLSLLEAALESLARPRPLLHTLDVAGILHDNVVIVHENVHLAVRVVVVLVVIIVVIAH
jgi:hypothetical protein